MSAFYQIKIMFAFCFMIMISACSGVSYDNSEKEKQNIINVLTEQQNAWNRGDITEYMKAYWKSDSLLFIGKSGPKFGWKEILDNYKKGYPDKEVMGILKFTFLKIGLQSPTDAFVIGKWELTRQNDKPNGYFTLIMRKNDGIWRVIIDHSS